MIQQHSETKGEPTSQAATSTNIYKRLNRAQTTKKKGLRLVIRHVIRPPCLPRRVWCKGEENYLVRITSSHRATAHVYIVAVQTYDQGLKLLISNLYHRGGRGKSWATRFRGRIEIGHQMCRIDCPPLPSRPEVMQMSSQETRLQRSVITLRVAYRRKT